MNRNTLLAIIISMAVIFGWSMIGPKLFPQYFPHPQKPKDVASTDHGQTEPAPREQESAAPQAAPADSAQAHLPEEQEIVIETAKASYILSSKGAALKAVKLRPIDELDKTEIPLLFLVDQPGLLAMTDFAGSSLENHAFSVKEIGPASVAFETELAGNILYERTYQFYDDHFHIDVSTKFTNMSDQSFSGTGYSMILARSIPADKDEVPFTFSMIYNKDTRALEYEKFFGKDILKTYEGLLGWAGIQNKYFAQLFWTDTPFTQTSIRRFKEERDTLVVGRRKGFELAGRASLTDTVRLFVGPKDYDILRSYDNHLDKIIYMGVFGKISLGLLYLLRYLYGVFKSYGIAIVILTVLVKVLLHPLTHKSFQSMKVQKDLAPKITALREKHKNDPQKAQKEMMALYRKEGVNPLSGCFPVLLQLPVFFALFSTLRSSFELRHESFLWVPDLASKDPLYILPILTLGLTILQQKMTPTAGDKQQQKMMMIFMVIFMSMIMFTFPAGLLIYWFASSLISLLQQRYYFRHN